MSEEIGTNLVKELGVRSQGRNPIWASHDLSSNSGAPLTASAGVDISNAINALYTFECRRQAHVYESRVTLTTSDLSATYTVTIDANAVNYDAGAEAPADAVELLEGIATAINADGTVGGIVDAQAQDLDGDGVIDTITLQNEGGEATTHTTAVGATGAGELAFEEDLTQMQVRLWLLPDQSDDSDDLRDPCWVHNDAADFTVDRRGYTDRADVAGFARMYAEMYSTTSASGSNGAGYIRIGPGGIG